MPAVTPDQGLSLPVGADIANNPAAFNNFVAGVEPRLVRLYTNAADRTTRQLVVAENELSALAAEDRIEVYNGAANVSLMARTGFARMRTAVTQTVTPSSTTLQNVTNFVVTLPTAGTFEWWARIFYDASVTADIKFAYVWPAGATAKWGLNALSTGGTNPGYGVQNVSSASLAAGGVAVGTQQFAIIQGEIVMGGTGGNLQFQAAQNTSDASSTNIFDGSLMEIYRTV